MNFIKNIPRYLKNLYLNLTVAKSKKQEYYIVINGRTYETRNRR